MSNGQELFKTAHFNQALLFWFTSLKEDALDWEIQDELDWAFEQLFTMDIDRDIRENLSKKIASMQKLFGLEAVDKIDIKDNNFHLTNPFCATILDHFIYLSDEYSHKIVKVNMQGDLIWEIGAQSPQKVDLFYPQGLAIGEFKKGEDHLYCCDLWNHCIKIFSLDGQMVYQFGQYGSQPGEFNEPYDLSIRQDKLLVADRCNHRIQQFDLQGNFKDSSGQRWIEETEAQKKERFWQRFSSLTPGNLSFQSFAAKLPIHNNSLIFPAGITFVGNNLMVTDRHRRLWLEPNNHYNFLKDETNNNSQSPRNLFEISNRVAVYDEIYSHFLLYGDGGDFQFKVKKNSDSSLIFPLTGKSAEQNCLVSYNVQQKSFTLIKFKHKTPSITELEQALSVVSFSKDISMANNYLTDIIEPINFYNPNFCQNILSLSLSGAENNDCNGPAFLTWLKTWEQLETKPENPSPFFSRTVETGSFLHYDIEDKLTDLFSKFDSSIDPLASHEAAKFSKVINQDSITDLDRTEIIACTPLHFELEKIKIELFRFLNSFINKFKTWTRAYNIAKFYQLNSCGKLILTAMLKNCSAVIHHYQSLFINKVINGFFTTAAFHKPVIDFNNCHRPEELIKVYYWHCLFRDLYRPAIINNLFLEIFAGTEMLTSPIDNIKPGRELFEPDNFYHKFYLWSKIHHMPLLGPLFSDFENGNLDWDNSLVVNNLLFELISLPNMEPLDFLKGYSQFISNIQTFDLADFTQQLKDFRAQMEISFQPRLSFVNLSTLLTDFFSKNQSLFANPELDYLKHLKWFHLNSILDIGNLAYAFGSNIISEIINRTYTVLGDRVVDDNWQLALDLWEKVLFIHPFNPYVHHRLDKIINS